MLLEPVTFALKLAFVAVLFLFVLWVARSALRDLRDDELLVSAAPPSDATGFHAAAGAPTAEVARGAAPRLIIKRMQGQRAGLEYDLPQRTTLGRGDVEISFDDAFASSRHARIELSNGLAVIEDLGSTNGTYVNGDKLEGPWSLRSGDQIAIGDTVFEYRD
ncbi:MAG: FHA domain-containing protein [Solirubrobacteraceae bacterium]|nr:FHA domain-containing protein [Solirubrobacteraceae bacterium]